VIASCVGRLSLVLALATGAACVPLAAGASASRTAPASAVGALPVLKGIPQHGLWLGSRDAKVTLVEYVDVQCPYCGRFSREVFPTVVRRYVRTGRVRVLLRGLAFVGPDSATGLRWALAAGRQHRLWNVLEQLFASQGEENSGWINAARLTSIARRVPGLELAALRRDSAGADVGRQMRAAAEAAQRASVPGTPFFEAGRSLGDVAPLRLTSFDPLDFTSQLDKLLR